MPVSMPPQNSDEQPIAYIAGLFPLRSETFVYREVRAHRENGTRVECVSLRPSPAPPENADDLRSGVLIVYDYDTALQAFVELASRPIRSIGTLSVALGDALLPGEPTSLSTRAKLLSQAYQSLGIARRLRQRDVVHVQAHFAHAPTTIAMYVARQLSIPFSFTGHANDIFQRRSLLAKKLRRTKFVACISRFHRQFYQQLEPKMAPGEVIRCGVDIETWRPGEDRRVGDEPLRLVTICRLVEKKGVDVLVRALAAMKTNAVLQVGGDGPEMQKLRHLSSELGCDGKIEWRGAVENDEARKMIQASAVFVLPCRTDQAGDRDGIPVALMEAMACERVVVSGDLPAIRELIEDEDCGYLLSRSEPQRLADLLDSLDLRAIEKVGKAARKKIEREFALKQNVALLSDLIRR